MKETVRVKIGRQEYELGAEDVILYNGKLYQLISQSYVERGTFGGRSYSVLSQAKAKQWLKAGILVEREREMSNLGVPCVYYGIDVKKLKGMEAE